MRMILRYVTAICLLVAFSACTPAPRDPFAYAAAPFSVTVEGTYLPANDPDGIPRPIAALVTVGAPLNGDPALRDLAVAFTAPESLAGVTVTALASPAPDGTVGRSVTFSYPSDYGGIEVTAKGREFDGLLRFAEAWLPAGDVAEVSPAAPDGSYTVTRRGGEGGYEASFRFAPDRDLPVGVTVTSPAGVLELTAE